MPSCLLSERSGSALHVGEFVHVREVEGRDKGQLKVYRIEKLRASDRHFYGQYWEQPRFGGSSLREHDFKAQGREGIKELPEIVQTSEKWWIPLALVSSDPVFHFHWMDLTTTEATPVGIAGAYVFGRRIQRSSAGNWFSRALSPADIPSFTTRSAFALKHGLVTQTERIWDTYRLLGDTIQAVLQQGATDELSESECIRGFDDVRWALICSLHSTAPRSMPERKCSKQLKVTADFGFFKKARTDEVQSLKFVTMTELHMLTKALGRFWNVALYTRAITQQPGDKFRAHPGMNIKVVHPKMTHADITLVKHDPEEYRKKKHKRKTPEGRDTLGAACRKPGVYLTYTKGAGRSTGSLTVSVSWHDKPYMGGGWEEVVQKLLV